jgi:Asp-tRNA(Asn)/Glu-tRNA(Gln) amidotransferase A subunit family amidase
MTIRATIQSVIALAALACAAPAPAQAPFVLEEASIESIHSAIRSGQTTCEGVVRGYIDRARAYNGVCTTLVTEDGAAVSPVRGSTRAGAPLEFPTETVAIGALVPDYASYKGKTPDFGRMETTASDPAVFQQFGMVAGIPNAGQVNALETLNVRGERSVTCKGVFDAHPSTGPLPAGAPAECEAFRKQPDALERARELDALYGRSPDTKAMPLYCTAMSFKAVYDTADMRSTGGGDVNYATDFAPRDSTLVRRLRDAGAIIYAKAHNAEYNGGSGDPGGAAEVERPQLATGGARETWGGMTCNPYDTTRQTGGSSGGSGASVAANLVVCSICESTGGSCRNPGTHNGVVTFVPTKGMISYGGGIGADPVRDRPGITCRSVEDAATVFDAFRDKDTGEFFDARDIFTALPRSFASDTPYVAALSDPGAAQPLAGMRVGVVRELMVKSSPADAAIVDGIERELSVLRSLGAELVESTGPGYTDDPAIPNMTLNFENAIAEVLPFHMPEVLSWKKDDGTPEFVVPGYDVTSRDYLVAAASLRAPWPANLDFRRIFGSAPEAEGHVSGYTFSFNLAQYLLQRGDRRVKDWASLNANAKYFSDVRRTAMENWENKPIDIATDDVSYIMRRKEVMRMVMLKVLEQNDIDVFVNPPLLALPGKIGQPTGGGGGGSAAGHGYGARLGIPEVFVPAGFSATIVEPTFALNEDGTDYDSERGTTPTKLERPLPFNIAFWSGPGEEALVLKVASAYEAATQHRRAPEGFGPVKTDYQSGAATGPVSASAR